MSEDKGFVDELANGVVTGGMARRGASYELFLTRKIEDGLSAIDQDLVGSAEVRLGDSLSQAIDVGLAKSWAGLVVLSHNFFNKHWPRQELDDLTTRKGANGRLRILPIWLGVSQAEVASYSPPLANVEAADPTVVIDMAMKIARVVGASW